MKIKVWDPSPRGLKTDHMQVGLDADFWCYWSRWSVENTLVMADETAIESGRAAKALKCYFDDKWWEKYAEYFVQTTQKVPPLQKL